MNKNLVNKIEKNDFRRFFIYFLKIKLTEFIQKCLRFYTNSKL
jgi:hypothetical protein